jgi:pyruvate/2-oxoglutarate dehydrogenase complex dihydrolipoamide dehydrogenase (E3) component
MSISKKLRAATAGGAGKPACAGAVADVAGAAVADADAAAAGWLALVGCAPTGAGRADASVMHSAQAAASWRERKKEKRERREKLMQKSVETFRLKKHNRVSAHVLAAGAM